MPAGKSCHLRGTTVTGDVHVGKNAIQCTVRGNLCGTGNDPAPVGSNNRVRAARLAGKAAQRRAGATQAARAAGPAKL